MAKQIGADGEDLTIPSLGTGPGTLKFMSPEQVTEGRMDTRSDLYSLALVFSLPWYAY